MSDQPARGSDDDYCSAYPAEPHHLVSSSVDAYPIRWVVICSLCGHISNRELRAQLPTLFIVDTPEGERVASYAGNLIVATTEQEIGDGPSRHTASLESRVITVTEWIKEHG